jgi:hypothetical protein
MNVENLAQFLVLGVPIAVIIPLVIEEAKKVGMPTTWTGVASMVTALVIVSLSSAAQGTFALQSAAEYALQAIVYGLAANGVYSQARLLFPQREVA